MNAAELFCNMRARRNKVIGVILLMSLSFFSWRILAQDDRAGLHIHTSNPHESSIQGRTDAAPSRGTVADILQSIERSAVETERPSNSGFNPNQPVAAKKTTITITTEPKRTEHSEYDYVWEDEVILNQKGTKRPWGGVLNDTCCISYQTTFGSNLALHGLISFPSSGNTWMRYLIESSTGIFTGSEYDDPGLFATGMLGEIAPMDSGWTIVQKSHGFSVGTESERERRLKVLGTLGCGYILLIRHPGDAIVATRNFDAGGQMGFTTPADFSGPDWDKYVQWQLERWTDLYMERLHACSPAQMLVIIYEQLKENLLTQLIRMLRFLQINPEAERMQCLLRYPDGHKKRNHSSRAKVDVFSSAQKQLLTDHVTRVNQVLEVKGWPQVPHKW